MSIFLFFKFFHEWRFLIFRNLQDFPISSFYQPNTWKNIDLKNYDLLAVKFNLI